MGTAAHPARRRRNRLSSLPANSPQRIAIEYAELFAGTLILAWSFNVFFVPHQIASGGVSGISVLLEHLWGWEPAFTQWGLNIGLFILGYFLLGKQSGFRTAVGSLLLPLLVYLTRDAGPVTANPLLASIFGGLGTGLGLGMVFRGRGSTGGLNVAAMILHKYTGLTLGVATAVFDGLVIVAAGLMLSPEKALYALIGLFVTTKAIDAVQLGLGYSKVAFIISDKKEQIEQAILLALNRGLTKLPGYGGYTGKEKTVYMTVIGQTEVTRLKSLVYEKDPDAFIVISNAHEVLGEGFKRHSPE